MNGQGWQNAPTWLATLGEPERSLWWLGAVAYVALALWLVQTTFDNGRRWVALMVAAIALLILALGMHMADAHDHTRPDLDKWYPQLQSKMGPCCDGPGKDAKHLQDPEWKVITDSDGKSHYEVYLDGNWIKVPDGAVVNAPNLDGQALVWPFKGAWGGTVIRCFMPGVMG